MVGSKRCIVALSVIYITMTLLTLLADADNKQLCVTATDKKFCEKLVHGASDWTQAMTIAITEAMKHINSIQNSDYKFTIHKGRSATLGNTVENLCTECYANTWERLKESLELARSGDKDGKLNLRLSSALTSLEDCSSVLVDLKQDMSSLVKMNRDLNHCIKVCLAIDKSKSVKRSE